MSLPKHLPWMSFGQADLTLGDYGLVKVRAFRAINRGAG